MKKLLIILAPVGLLGGAAAGIFLAPPPPEEPVEEAAEVEETESEGAYEEVAPPPRKKKKTKPTEEELNETDYAKLDKQFVVPVVEGERVKALVVVTLAVEVEAGMTDLVYKHEPKLRDEFLNVLFNHTQSGGFTGNFADPGAMTDLRASLDLAAQRVIGDAARQVLVTSIVKQDT